MDKVISNITSLISDLETILEKCNDETIESTNSKWSSIKIIIENDISSLQGLINKLQMKQEKMQAIRAKIKKGSE